MLKLVGETTAEPVSLSELKTHLRMESTDSTSENTLLKSYINSARKQAENLTKRALVASTWNVFMDDFEGSTSTIELPRPPLSTVSTNVLITYVKSDTAGSSTTIDSSSVTVDSDSEPGRVFPSYGNVWPTGVRDQRNAVTVSFVSGYTTVNPCPEPIKNWIKIRAAHWYENREPFVVEQSVRKIHVFEPSYIDGLLDQYIIPSVAT